MKRIGNITQTYSRRGEWSPDSDGKDRSFLINYLLKDSTQIKLRNLLDVHLFTFHNVDLGIAKSMANKIKEVVPNTKSICYYDMYFCETIERNLAFLKEQGVTDVLWLQDDDFFVGNETHLFELFEFYRNNPDIHHVSFGFTYDSLKPIGHRKRHKISENFYIYESRSSDFHNTGFFAMDNSPFICNLEMLCTAMYSKNIFDLKISRAYDLEQYLRFNSLKNDIVRCTTNETFFSTFNIVGLGGSLGSADKNLAHLKQKFGSPVSIQES